MYITHCAISFKIFGGQINILILQRVEIILSALNCSLATDCTQNVEQLPVTGCLVIIYNCRKHIHIKPLALFHVAQSY